MVSDSQVYIDRYQQNYKLWMKEILGADVTFYQNDASHTLLDKNFVAIKSGTGTGKTAFDATVALWFQTTRPESKIVCTAPTGHQLEDLLFAEMHTWIRRIKYDKLRESIKVIKDKIYIEGYRDWYIVARTIPRDNQDKLGDVLAGFHAPHLLFICDEASGIPDSVFAGISGSMLQKNTFALLTGNPTRNTGFFYDAFHKNKAKWTGLTFSSLNSPFNSQAQMAMDKEIYGEDSDFYRTKVLGEFPIGSSTTLFSIDAINAAIERWHQFNKELITGVKVAGLDCGAGHGDYSVLTMRQGCYIFEPLRIKHSDTVDLVSKTHTLCLNNKVRELYVDYTGLGVGVYDQLKRKGGVRTFKVIMNARANNPEAYKNLRAELFKELSENFGELALSDHDRFVMELPEICEIQDKVPMQIVDKPYLRGRLGFSPDFSDSLMLSTYRHFNFDRFIDDALDLSGYMDINDKLVKESSFAKL